ncbi:MAG: OmpA family protein [Ignavibacteriales bacterium]|nr:OmpA family protein [Ignavibacteriales bacterium]
MKRLLSKAIILVLMPAILSLGCGASKTVQGGAIGAAAGGILGGIIGKQSGHTATGAIIGAVIGGAAGALIGRYMDKQAEEMERDIEGAKVERVGEGIKITFDSGILFDINKSDLQSEAKKNLDNLAKILNKYNDTNILIEGHTDSTGTVEHNMTLSNQRSESVSNYLKGLNVIGSRITTAGYGPNQPVSTNTTVEGRRLNRRVEVAIFANEKLKDAAEKGQLKY